jgi:RNA polymerase sigma-70 factor (ECF subfamily)
MGAEHRTTLGGPDALFHTTHWTQLADARTPDADRRREVLDAVCRQYWKPVYCYLRRKGIGNEEAKDLTQGFFEKVVLGRRLIPRAERGKGRFRNFLLVALERYVRSVRRAEAAGKRSPRGRVLDVDGLDSPGALPPAPTATPDQAFAHAWASALLDSAISRAREECAAAGLGVHWALFEARVLRPIMDGVEPPSLAWLCERHGLSGPERASNMVVTARRRLRKAMRGQVRRLVASEEEVDEEIRDVMSILSAGGAGAARHART